MITRRNFLNWTATGLGSAATASLLTRDASATPPKLPHSTARAKRVIHICLCGGLSQVDSFDYKPKLKELHGKPLQTDEKPDVFFGQVGLLRANDWEFKQRGESGLWISELFPHIATVADELAVINSMVAESSSHTPATYQQSSGFRLNGFPVMGSWVSYGLGNITDDLPTYVVLPDARGLPASSTSNWTNGFLPAVHQGVPFRTSGEGDVISNLFPAREIDARVEHESRALLEKFNRIHMGANGAEDAFSARIASYELAARMQLTVPEVTSISGESAATKELYGLSGEDTRDFGRSCLLARRLLERGYAISSSSLADRSDRHASTGMGTRT